MRVAGVARAEVGVPVLGWLVLAFGAACGAGASGGVEEEGSAESVVRAVTAAEAASSPAAAPANEGSEGAADEGAAEDSASAAASTPLVVPGGPPITAPPSGPPSPPPTGELNTPISLDRLAPAEVVIEPGDCRFEFLGERVRCEHAGWPNVLETDAGDLVTCMQQCLERDDCSAVTDYLWLGKAELGCYLYLSTCDDPVFETTWGEEDGGRDFRRQCAAPSPD